MAVNNQLLLNGQRTDSSKQLREESLTTDQSTQTPCFLTQFKSFQSSKQQKTYFLELSFSDFNVLESFTRRRHEVLQATDKSLANEAKEIFQEFLQSDDEVIFDPIIEKFPFDAEQKFAKDKMKLISNNEDSEEMEPKIENLQVDTVSVVSKINSEVINDEVCIPEVEDSEEMEPAIEDLLADTVSIFSKINSEFLNEVCNPEVDTVSAVSEINSEAINEEAHITDIEGSEEMEPTIQDLLAVMVSAVSEINSDLIHNEVRHPDKAQADIVSRLNNENYEAHDSEVEGSDEMEPEIEDLLANSISTFSKINSEIINDKFHNTDVEFSEEMEPEIEALLADTVSTVSKGNCKVIHDEAHDYEVEGSDEMETEIEDLLTDTVSTVSKINSEVVHDAVPNPYKEETTPETASKLKNKTEDPPTCISLCSIQSKTSNCYKLENFGSSKSSDLMVPEANTFNEDILIYETIDNLSSARISNLEIQEKSMEFLNEENENFVIGKLNKMTSISVCNQPSSLGKCSNLFETKKSPPISNLEQEDVARTLKDFYKCNDCQLTFKTDWLLQNHLRSRISHVPFPCKVCSLSFKDSKALEEHLVRHKKQSFHCRQCKRSFSLSIQLKKHSCEHKADNKADQLTQKQKSTRKRFRCIRCFARFNLETELQEHSITHIVGHTLKKRSFHCRRCKRSFGLSIQLKKHFCAQQVANKAKSVLKNQKPTVRMFLCVHCFARFNLECELKEHLVTHIDKKSFKKQSFICKRCNRSFDLTIQLKKHFCANQVDKLLRLCKKQKPAFRRFRCIHCFASFNLESELKDHSITHADKETQLLSLQENLHV